MTGADDDLRGLEALERFADGDQAPELLEWVRASFALWLRQGGALHATLDVPLRGDRAALLLRDRWLRRAAQALPGTTTERARHIVVQARRLGVWRDLPAPPSTATAAEHAIWRAMHTAAIPASIKHVARIIGPVDMKPRVVSTKVA